RPDDPGGGVMSQQHDPDCSEVIHQIFTFIDNEMDQADCAVIQKHLDECTPCLKQFGLEQDLRSLIARCCGGDQAPASLHQRIRLRISELTIETTRVEYRAE
ncbi:MAG TPA: mycothiol system anti-sigma-R factor, partial [Jatrophihabitans sp.]|nr:mycothiol system anti-sigma-R factor [Jatrophihabitans sp.]